MGALAGAGDIPPPGQPSCSYSFELEQEAARGRLLVFTRRRQWRWQGLQRMFASLAASRGAPPLEVGKKRRRQRKVKHPGDSFVPLPVGVVEDGRAMRYAWNGHHIQAVEPDVLVNGETGLGNLRAKLRHMRHSIVEAFFPSREAVTPDYWEYVWWRAGHRLSSAMVNNFATQSLLAAVGVGAQKQLPAAATINWLLKDGLGRLGRLSVAASFGQSFDSDLKRFRWLTSLIFTGSIALEYLTPRFPRHFLLLASLSNVGKSVGVTTYVATHPAFMRSFAKGENLADINAKGQAQQMVMDTLGLALCVSLTFAVRHNPRGRALLPLAAFPALAAADLFCIFHELKATHLRTLNRERAELVAERWLADGTVFSAGQVSRQERHLLPSQVGGGRYPLHFSHLEEAVDSPAKLTQLLARHRGQSFLLSYLPSAYRPPYLGSRECQGHLAATLQEGAPPQAILAAVLQAAVFRRLVAGTDPLPPESEPAASGSGRGGAWDWAAFRRRVDATGAELMAGRAARREAWSSWRPGVKGVRWRWRQLDAEAGERALAASAELARAAAPHFVADLQAAEWQTHPFMISTHERGGFVMMPVDS